MSFPETSRFGGCSNLPDLKSFRYEKDGKQMLFNNQASSISYNPYVLPQLKTKASVPIDFFHQQNKITISDMPLANSIPTLELTDLQKQDPIGFIESAHELGKKSGAIKLTIPESTENPFKANFQINSDLFWFQANKLLNNPIRNELESRLKFHRELMKFLSIHRKETEVNESVSPETAWEAKDDKKKLGTSHMLLQKLPMIDKRPLDLYKLFRCVMIRGGFLEVINKKLWAQIGRELGYKGKIMTSLSSSLKSSYLKILYPFEEHLGSEKFEFVGLETPRSQVNDQVEGEVTVKEENTNSIVPTVEVSSQKHTTDKKEANEEMHDDINGMPPISDPSSEKADMSLSEIGTLKEGDDLNTTGSFNENGKRIHDEDGSAKGNLSIKKLKSSAPLILGSSKDFKRSLKIKSSKGILLNTPHLIDIKQPNMITPKPDEMSSDSARKRKKTGNESFFCTITPASQINHCLKNMISTQSITQDNSRLSLNGKYASVYNLRQFMEKDLKFQEYIIQKNADFFKKLSSSNEKFFYQFNDQNVFFMEKNVVSLEKFEELYWSFVQNETSDDFSLDGIELENGFNIPSFVNGSGFSRIGDDFFNHKVHMMNSNLNVPSPSAINSSQTTNPSAGLAEAKYYTSRDYISRITRASLNPWNLHNLPILPNSLLGALSESDINNQDIINPTLNIGMTFSAENWRCEDHFTQLCNYQFFGSCRKWYFIPELEFEKFEALVEKVNEENRDRANKNNTHWNASNLLKYFSQKEGSTLDYEVFYNALENMINPYPDNMRLRHSNPLFEKLIEGRAYGPSMNYNQDFMITPSMLEKAGINFTSTIQKPGEFIIKLPKTYSLTISFGFNLSEEVNFATRDWLDYALEGEKWLKKQNILPAFLAFKMFINIIQLYESGSKNTLHFKPECYSRISEIYIQLYKEEIRLRNIIRLSFGGIRELVLDEKSFSDIDTIADDDLSNTFPSKIVLTDTKTKQSFILSIRSFLAYMRFEEFSRDDHSSIPKLTDVPNLKIEMHLCYSDDKLKYFHKVLSSYSVDYDSWMTNYERTMNENPNVPLKVYKSLLMEGEKIYAAVSSSNLSQMFDQPIAEESKDYESLKLRTFKEYIENLRAFLEDADNFIDECQTILAVKHQQRIRGNSQNEYFNEGVDTLARLARVIGKISTLNFSCPETEQLLEFKTEIENFDRACRALIQKERSNNTLREFNNLISLGKSFGVELPSLVFLIRIRDKLKWLDLLQLIFSGQDPNGDSNEVFSLDDLKKFREEGISILGKDDVEKIKLVDLIISQSEQYDAEFNRVLDCTTPDILYLAELEERIKDFNERNKDENEKRIFIYNSTLERAIDIKTNTSVIEKFIEFNQSLNRTCEYKHQDAKSLLLALQNMKLQILTENLQKEIQKCDEWLADLKEQVMRTRVVSTIYKDVSSLTRLALHAHLLEKIEQMTIKLDLSLGLDSDHYVNSSSFAYLLECKIVASGYESNHSAETQKYCICREIEFGTMIGCDSCHEWYHINCVDGGDAQKNDSDSYSCPLCRFINTGSDLDLYLKEQLKLKDLDRLIERGINLLVYSPDELEGLKELSTSSHKMYEALEKDCHHILTKADNETMTLDKLHFYLRKVYGSCVINWDFLMSLFDRLKEIKHSESILKPKAEHESRSLTDLSYCDSLINLNDLEVQKELKYAIASTDGTQKIAAGKAMFNGEIATSTCEENLTIYETPHLTNDELVVKFLGNIDSSLPNDVQSSLRVHATNGPKEPSTEHHYTQPYDVTNDGNRDAGEISHQHGSYQLEEHSSKMNNKISLQLSAPDIYTTPQNTQSNLPDYEDKKAEFT